MLGVIKFGFIFNSTCCFLHCQNQWFSQHMIQKKPPNSILAIIGLDCKNVYRQNDTKTVIKIITITTLIILIGSSQQEAISWFWIKVEITMDRMKIE